MTILTKQFAEKKGDKLVVPLVNENQLPTSAPEDVEAQPQQRVVIFPVRAHHSTTSTTLCVLFTALTVVGIGMFGGIYLYEKYLSVSKRMPTSQSFTAEIPMKFDDLSEENGLMDNGVWNSSPYTLKENIEVSDEGRFEKIDVPDFKDGRSGRFIHDFNTNITGIIDITGRHCFVMPLNRATVLPPKSLFDLIQKMWEGYYKVDTNVVKKTMKVLLPPIKDTKVIGEYIVRECDGLPIFKLEKYVGGVVKRSADRSAQAKFSEFAGKFITELDIVNMDDVLAYEKNANTK